MIERYTRPEMGRIWSAENRFAQMLRVEKSVAEVQAAMGMIPRAAAQAIQKKGTFKISRILELEKTTKHDVIAFVSAVAESVGPMGRYVHFGMTSSDVLDTALSLQIGEGAKHLDETLDHLERVMLGLIKRYKITLCAGRTHGMHAEPTSFGLKMLGHLMEVRRNRVRLNRAIAGVSIGKLSGAVGTYSFLDRSFEARVCRKLKLTPESVATQVIPRDRHAEVIMALAFIGAGLERLAIELRHLQRTEVSEVCEGFSKGQKGSSAMPHKKNPISAENITGAARLLRAYSGAALENISLWHERDISHSSVERVVFPDAFILTDYIVDRMAELLEKLYVDEERMRTNMLLSQGQLFSSHLLLALVEKGMSREEAYGVVQRLSHQLGPGEQLGEVAATDSVVKAKLSKREIASLFSGEKHRAAIVKNINFVLAKKG